MESDAKIGSIRLSSPFCQAGLAGYSDRAMRLVARRRGCPYALTEALLDTIMLSGGLGLKKSIDINDEDHPTAGQIIGSEPDTMAPAAAILAGRGYDVDRGHAILRKVRERLPHATLTLSLRRAFDDSDEHRNTLYELLDEAWDLGYAAARVHGRTVEQKYQGRANWEALRLLKAHYPKQTIIGSGDVFTAEDAVRMKVETGVDIVWIARGAIGNPWIFRDAQTLYRHIGDPTNHHEIHPPTIYEQRDALAEHFAEAMKIHGEQLAGRRMRKQGIKYARFHPQAAEVKKGFIDVASITDWSRTLDRWYTADGPGVWPAPEAADEVNDPQTCEM